MSEDLIRRSDAIKAMEQRYQDILRIFKRKVKDGEKAIALDMIGCIKSLPSADRPQGEWIDMWDQYGFEGTFKCSVCGTPWTLIDGTPQGNGMNFCPNCGADMRKGADDEYDK